MKKSFMLVAVLTLSGCIQNRMYINPTGENTVKITFQDSSSQITTQSIMVFEDDYDCYDVRYVSFFGEAQKQRQFRAKLRANYTINYAQTYRIKGIAGGLSMQTCGGAYTFPTKPKFEYLIQTGNNELGCFFLVSEKPEDEIDNWSNVKATKRVSQQPMWNAGPYCEADEAFKGSSSLAIPRPGPKNN